MSTNSCILPSSNRAQHRDGFGSGPGAGLLVDGRVQHAVHIRIHIRAPVVLGHRLAAVAAQLQADRLADARHARLKRQAERVLHTARACAGTIW